ncbi:MAG: Maf family protein [Thermoleophilaceae bacterium]
MARRLVLASRSPQRRAILEQIGVELDVDVPDVEELSEGEPVEVATENAVRKAQAVDGDLVVAADTVVYLDGRIYGKPRDEHEAAAFLRDLSGREHEVVTAVAVREGSALETLTAWTAVTFRDLDESLLRWYVDSGEWRDRAGGYAIQGKGAALVDWIEGDYLNVVGLPLATLLKLKPDLPLRHG